MQSSPPKRKKCLEVTGGRLTYRANHEMPGMSMQIYSRRCGDCSRGGGEVHYLSSCASGRITRVLLADICGSGEVFKRLSCEMRNGLIRSINSIWQNRVVSDVGKKFREFAEQGGFGTASVTTYFAPTRSFMMCNIGNPPALIFRARERTWEVVHGETNDSESSVQIEGVYGEHEYRHFKTKLEVDDLVVIYGNGFAQSSFPDGGIVGHKRLVSALEDSPNADPSARLDHLVRVIQDNNPPSQDSTVLVCRVNKSGVRVRDNLLAPLRLLQRPKDNSVLS